MKKVILFGILAGVAGVLSAQETPRFAANFGAGFTTPVLSTGSQADTGWNVRAGLGYNFSPYVGALIDAGIDQMGINSTTLGNLGYSGGGLNIFSLTLDPIVHLTPKRGADLYVTGGGGYFREMFTFSDAAAGFMPGTNSTFGFAPAAAGNTTIPNNYSINKPGLDGGVGLALGSKWGGKFFAEVRYVRIFSGSYHTDYVPVTFGYRR